MIIDARASLTTAAPDALDNAPRPQDTAVLLIACPSTIRDSALARVLGAPRPHPARRTSTGDCRLRPEDITHPRYPTLSGRHGGR